MTHDRTIGELERFRTTVAELSRELPEDSDFWPAYAEKANTLEAACPTELKDYARESIRRTIQTVSAERAAARLSDETIKRIEALSQSKTASALTSAEREFAGAP